MPALSAFADILDKAADLLVDPAITSDELDQRGLPGQRGDENKLLTRTRDQVVKRFGPSDDLRVDVEIFLQELSQLRRPKLSWEERTHWAAQLRGQAEELREFVAARLKKAKELRRLRKSRSAVSSDDSKDRPVAPDGFRHDGNVYDTPPLARGPFRALSVAWESEGRCAESRRPCRNTLRRSGRATKRKHLARFARYTQRLFPRSRHTVQGDCSRVLYSHKGRQAAGCKVR